MSVPFAVEGVQHPQGRLGVAAPRRVPPDRAERQDLESDSSLSESLQVQVLAGGRDGETPPFEIEAPDRIAVAVGDEGGAVKLGGVNGKVRFWHDRAPPLFYAELFPASDPKPSGPEAGALGPSLHSAGGSG